VTLIRQPVINNVRFWLAFQWCMSLSCPLSRCSEISFENRVFSLYRYLLRRLRINKTLRLRKVEWWCCKVTNTVWWWCLTILTSIISVTDNRRDGITTACVYVPHDEHKITQLKVKTVRDSYSRRERTPTAKCACTLFDESTTTRCFGDWSQSNAVAPVTMRTRSTVTVEE